MVGSYVLYILDVVDVNIVLVLVLITALILGLVWRRVLGGLGRGFLDSGDMGSGIKVNLDSILIFS